jgi:type II secretory pathway predicted ATPase ExeA
MRETYHGLKRRPFPTTPDLSCYFPAQSHETALTTLKVGLADGEGVLLLQGPPGIGKTLLGHALLDSLDTTAVVVFLTHGCYPTRSALLQAILYDLGLPHEGKRDHELRLALTDHVLKNYASGKRTVLLIDEAHYLAIEALEELRLLGNLEGRGGKAIQIVLIGLPGLRDLLERPALASFRQRIAIRATLEPLSLAEAAEYLAHHIRLAGGVAQRVLTDEGIDLLVHGTQGIPRLLNQAGHLALSLAAQVGMTVDAEVTMEALGALGLTIEESHDKETPVPIVEDELAPILATVSEGGIDPRVVNPHESSPRIFLAPGEVG